MEAKEILVKKALVEINTDAENSNKIEIEGNADILKPKNGENNSVVVFITVKTKEENTKFKIDFEAYIKYDFDNEPEDYEKMVMDNCVPDARNKLHKIIDDVMESARMQPLGLSKMQVEE